MGVSEKLQNYNFGWSIPLRHLFINVFLGGFFCYFLGLLFEKIIRIIIILNK